MQESAASAEIMVQAVAMVRYLHSLSLLPIDYWPFFVGNALLVWPLKAYRGSAGFTLQRKGLSKSLFDLNAARFSGEIAMVKSRKNKIKKQIRCDECISFVFILSGDSSVSIRQDSI